MATATSLRKRFRTSRDFFRAMASYDMFIGVTECAQQR
jgi:hypothetical protein